MIRLESVRVSCVFKTSSKRLQDVFKTSRRRLEGVMRTSWRRLENVSKTSWRCLEEIFARRLEDVLKMSWRVFCKTSWRRFEDVLARRLEDVLKTSSRRLHQDECLLDLIWVERGGAGSNFTPCWFSFNNSETVKAVTLAFCRIQQHFVRYIFAKFGIPMSLQSADFGENSERVISNFRISGQSLTKEIVITPEPVTTLTWNLDQ